MANETKRVKNGILAISDQIVVSAGTFLSTWLICRNCSDADFGIFTLAWTIVAFLRTMQERMIAAPFLAFTFRPGFNRKTFRGSSIAHQSIFSFVSSAIVLTISISAWLVGYGIETFWFGLSLAIASWFVLGREQMRSVSYTDFAISRLLILDASVVFTQLLGLTLLVWLDGFGLASANAILGFGCLLPIGFWLWLTKNTYIIDRDEVVLDWLHNWNYARWLVGARMLGIAPVIVIPWLIFSFQGEKGSGIFGACTSLVGVSLMFVQGANNVFQPRTVLELQKNGIPGLLQSIIESICIICAGLSFISLIFLFFGDNLLAIFGSQYVGFGFLTFLLSVSTLVVSISTIFANGLAALKKSKDFFLGEVSYCIVAIVSAFAFIPSHSLIGAAYAMILGGVATSIVSGLTLARGIRSYVPEVDLQSATQAPCSDQLEIAR